MKRYSIHSVAELLGISADAIRLYEKEGLVSPIRDESNGYRYYENEQIHRIMGIYLYRQLNVGLSEIKRLFKVDNFDGLEAEFDRLIQSNEAQIEQFRQNGEKLRFMKQHIENVHRGIDRYEVRELPARYVVFANDTGRVRYTEIKEIFNHPAFSYGNMCYHIMNDGERYRADSLQFVVREPMLNISPLKGVKDKLTRCESEKCLYTIKSFDEKDVDIEWNFLSMFEYAREHGMQCSGDVYAFYIYSLMSGEDIKDYYEIYIPLSGENVSYENA